MKHWKEFSLALLLAILSFIGGMYVQAREFNNLILSNKNLIAQRENTERALSNANEDLKKAFRQLGYNIPETEKEVK